MDKEYEGEILFGFEMDTYDALGMPEKIIHYRRSMSIIEMARNFKQQPYELSNRKN